MTAKITNGSTPNEKTTIYLDPRVKKGAQYYALRDDLSLSQIINDKLLDYLEEQADKAAVDAAHAEKDDFMPLEQVVQELGFNQDDLRHKAQSQRSQTAEKAR